jgi:hypothetical protein
MTNRGDIGPAAYTVRIVGPKMLHNTACQLLCKMGCPFTAITFSYGYGATTVR